jgi:sugar lactone lactonase YvrE
MARAVVSRACRSIKQVLLSVALYFTPIDGSGGALTESPVWDVRRGALLWCDIPARTVFELQLSDGARRSWLLPAPVGSFGLALDEKLIVACGHELLLLDRDDGSQRRLALIEPVNPRTRLNDGKVGPDGAFWVGTMDDAPAKEPIGALYRVAPDGRVERKADDLVISNGLAWLPDGRTMFHSDSRRGRIDVWDFDARSGAISRRRVLAQLDDSTGRPDGAATDMSGRYWSAGVMGGRLNLFSLDDGLLESIAFPAPAPTMPCFGGPDMRSLFVTSLRNGLSKEALDAAPLSGAVFYARTDVAGAPIPRFGG